MSDALAMRDRIAMICSLPPSSSSEDLRRDLFPLDAVQKADDALRTQMAAVTIIAWTAALAQEGAEVRHMHDRELTVGLAGDSHNPPERHLPKFVPSLRNRPLCPPHNDSEPTEYTVSNAAAHARRDIKTLALASNHGLHNFCDVDDTR